MTISDDLLFEVAFDYYVKNMLQKDIARKLGVSRVQVSKYLKMAVERKIVRIEVIPPKIPEKLEIEYAKLFKEKFDLKKLLLTNSHSNNQLLLQSLARKAWEFLSGLPDESLNIGIGWGTTMYTLATYEYNLQKHNWKIVPLSGGTFKLSDRHFDSNFIAQNFAERLNAKSIPVYFPFLMDNIEQKQQFQNTEEFTFINSMWNNLDIVICSVGYSISRSPLFRQNVFDGSTLNTLEKLKIVGDVLTHYFDINGKIYDLDFMKKVNNITFEQYMKSRLKIVVAGGFHKIESIAGLLKGKLTDVLITDINTAKNVIEYAAERDWR
ncbi:MULTISPECIES: sugar-binding transcriptional regulator [Pseudothermotoga]|jgi:DNA-binding transcriptional regulator LsrR (DeoR family)|uniref:Transcriptional regulator, DeoR family n=1 Tax=Pseudothermotoga lettingae (strain ATCC BAA-301 / DSM 14385 / NBRC 107922 / TMO) TaxID=416591 RepID=A8F7X8_PSELT|nr:MULTISPECIES: sugar-binding domain-containing protein [Pseudothermotoga]ABV34262.1 transcriptional regulator, DeoR family [Pseudothermotoga lettingae TMO]KUK21311.1 MAG: Transcriptional regulator, DeoR family [Pseudothermotoga lettingae]MDI3494952.1 deoxyribonucleoside regulator [Pseudothermotoga sp.]MDK2884868.1 deoxyribonucleoside regulator [Pseudothermotoga sp.]GLI48793.1 DNA-directed RNA polymerase sigma-70 factor [Pseudothermotoga lettingae TMO]